MGDVERRRRRIALLERKAADPGCTGPEREALLAKAAEMRSALLTRSTARAVDSLAEMRRATETFTATMGGRLFVDFRGFEATLRDAEQRARERQAPIDEVLRREAHGTTSG